LFESVFYSFTSLYRAFHRLMACRPILALSTHSAGGCERPKGMQWSSKEPASGTFVRTGDGKDPCTWTEWSLYETRCVATVFCTAVWRRFVVNKDDCNCQHVTVVCVCAGLAVVEGICSSMPVNICKDLGHYHVTETATHELGHKLVSTVSTVKLLSIRSSLIRRQLQL